MSGKGNMLQHLLILTQYVPQDGPDPLQRQKNWYKDSVNQDSAVHLHQMGRVTGLCTS